MPVALPDSNNYFPGLNHMQPDKVSHCFETLLFFSTYKSKGTRDVWPRRVI